MAPSPEEQREIVARCTRFLAYHYPKSVEQQLQEIAASPYAKMPKDHYGRGGFLPEFEADVAELLGKEAAVFMPSGTMAQQIALRIWCDRTGSKRVAFHPTCHLEIHEQGGYRELHGLQADLIGPPDGLFRLEDLERLDPFPAALLIELPQREIGGLLPSWDELQAILGWTRERGIRTHMDGARLWECRPHYGRSYAQIAAAFDSVYVSFYKILGGLPGAALAGPVDFIEEAKIWQRRHGGNLYQSAPNAISAKLGMDRHLPRMAEYCEKAREVARVLRELPGIRVIPEDPPTNLMHLHFEGDAERMTEAAWTIARDRGEYLFGGLQPTSAPGVSKLELTVGEATLDRTAEQIRAAFEEVLAAGRSPANIQG